MLGKDSCFGIQSFAPGTVTNNTVGRELSLQGKTTNTAGTHLVAAKPHLVLKPHAAFVPTMPRWEAKVSMPPPAPL